MSAAVAHNGFIMQFNIIFINFVEGEGCRHSFLLKKKNEKMCQLLSVASSKEYDRVIISFCDQNKNAFPGILLNWRTYFERNCTFFFARFTWNINYNNDSRNKLICFKKKILFVPTHKIILIVRIRSKTRQSSESSSMVSPPSHELYKYIQRCTF